MARRLLYAARRDAALPRGYHAGLLQVHDRKPFAASVEPTSRRWRRPCATPISASDTAEDGIHVFNGRQHRVATDAFSLFDGLGVEKDGAHAFYLGAELTKAEIAWRLGKRYAQDEPLSCGVAAPAPEADRTRLRPSRADVAAKQKKRIAMP